MFALEDIFIYMLILMRVFGMFIVVPFFAHRTLPPVARLALGGAFALMILPRFDFDFAYPETALGVIGWMAKEFSVGLMMGFAVRMVFFVIDFAAYIITVEVGLMPSPEFDPSNSNSFNPLGSVLYFLGLMVLLSGSEYDILLTFIRSYEVAPIEFTTMNTYAVDFVIAQTMAIFKVGALIAAPFIAVNFLINLVFAVMGKVVPKLNVFILSFPGRILAGTTVLAFSATLIVHYIINYLDYTPEMMLRFIIFRPVY